MFLKVLIIQLMSIKNTNQKGYSLPIPIILGVLVVLGIGAGVYYFSSKQTVSQQNNPTIAAASQTPTPTPKDETADPDSIGADWKTYTNTEAKVSLQYPSSWTIKEDTNVEYKTISIVGKEGNISLLYGGGFGGACPSGYEDFKVGNAQTQACHSTPADGSERWSLSSMKKDNVNFNNIDYSGFVTVSSPYKENRDSILKILSTFKFTN